MLLKNAKGVFVLAKRIGKYTIGFEEEIKIVSFGAVVGEKESKGPLGKSFDKIIYDPKASQKTWEQAESIFQQEAFLAALGKIDLSAEEIDFIFSGDLLNQCISSTYGLKAFSIPYLGQYGACSTMAQSLVMGAYALESGAGRHVACVTSSNFCSAERQYRFPLLYGGQRTPTAQWTVSGAGAAILSKEYKGKAPEISAATVGILTDLGVTDANNMGGAMAPAAAHTLKSYFEDTKTDVSHYDAVFTGDLGQVGSDVLRSLMIKEGYDLKEKYFDCGLMIFDRKKQDVHAGGSGCGCCASVLCGHILPQLKAGKLKDVLFIATGAMMSPTACMQGESIPCVAHLVRITA